MAGMVQAIDSFVVGTKEGDVLVKADDILDADHPIVRGMPAEFFRPLKAQFSVESATAAPGEKRKAHIRGDAATK